jgi:diacylglycerol O-acyltransferase / wax synthase
MTDLSHLSLLDGAFLHLESPEMPMHVGSLALFEAPPPDSGPWLDAVKAHVQTRMHLAPVFTRKLALMPFDLANPVWIRDDDIDIDYHIRHTVLPRPGTMAQLEALAARLHSSLLDRSRPLWEFYVIEGLEDGRIGFYSKVHHAAVDGQAAVAMANSVFDLTPEPRRVKPPRAPRTHRYQLGVAELLGAALGNQLDQMLRFAKLVPPLAGAVLGTAKTVVANRVRRGRTGAPPEAAGTRLKLAPATPFNASITNQRAFACASLPLADVKAIGRGLDASINDMVLWLCATALREYLKEGRELPERTLVAGVPISLRAEGDTSSNNQVSGTLIDLATQVADPMARLVAIRAGTRAMKAEMGVFRDLLPTDFPSLGSPWLLSGLASLYGRSRMAHRLRVANVVISNVPGPQVPLYLAGARMTGMYPLSIVVHGIGLNITVQSYLGQLCFGLISCRRAAPDVHELTVQLHAALAALRRLHASVSAAAAAEAVADGGGASGAEALAAEAIATAAASAGATRRTGRATRRARTAGPATRAPGTTAEAVASEGVASKGSASKAATAKAATAKAVVAKAVVAKAATAKTVAAKTVAAKAVDAKTVAAKAAAADAAAPGASDAGPAPRRQAPARRRSAPANGGVQ